jgi:hypothetical protein
MHIRDALIDNGEQSCLVVRRSIIDLCRLSRLVDFADTQVSDPTHILVQEMVGEPCRGHRGDRS